MGYGHPANGEHNFYGEFKTRKEAEDMMNRLNGEPMWVEDLYFPKGSEWGQEWDEEKVEEQQELDEEYETGEKSQFFAKKYRADAYNHPNRSPSYNVNRDRATDLLTSNKLDGRQKAEWSNKFLESAKSREDYLVDEHLLIEFLETFGEEPYYGA